MTLFQKLLLNRTRQRTSNLTSQYDRIKISTPPQATPSPDTFNGYTNISRRLTQQINQDNTNPDG